MAPAVVLTPWVVALASVLHRGMASRIAALGLRRVVERRAAPGCGPCVREGLPRHRLRAAAEEPLSERRQGLRRRERGGERERAIEWKRERQGKREREREREGEKRREKRNGEGAGEEAHWYA